jgi:hypothetical protein
MGHHLLLQCLGAIGERHVLLDVGPVTLGDPFCQTAHGVCLPRQRGPQFLANGLRAGRRLRAAGLLQQGRHP